MRVAGNQFTKKRELAPIRAVKKKTTPIPDNSTNPKVPDRYIHHSWMNMLTGKQESKSNSQLLQMGRSFIQWVEQQKTTPLFQTYWSTQGMLMDDLKALRLANKEFSDLVHYGNQLIGEMVARKLGDDTYNTRLRAPIYIKEYKDYDKEMIEYRERIRRLIEQADEMNKKEFIEALEKHFAPIPQSNVWIDKTKDENGERDKQQTNGVGEEQEPRGDI